MPAEYANCRDDQDHAKHELERSNLRELANIIITTQSSWARRYLKVIGQRFCLDTTVVEEDRLRVLLYYQLRGFRGTSVRHDVIPIDSK